MDDNNKYGTRERQEELLCMMKKVDAFCRNHSIAYSLDGGTLLGAIRHNGFIPWDDDIDIMVDRDNLNRLLKAFHDFHGETPYFLNRYLWVYRIQEVNDPSAGLFRPTIDIFVLDHCPNSGFKQKYKIFAIKMLQGMMKIKPNYKDKGMVMKACVFVTHILGKLFSDETKFRAYDYISQIGNEEPSAFVTEYNSLYSYLDRRYKSNILKKYIMHQFEDILLPITSEYDHYLTELYGDYMTPPKEQDRVSEHMK